MKIPFCLSVIILCKSAPLCNGSLFSLAGIVGPSTDARLLFCCSRSMCSMSIFVRSSRISGCECAAIAGWQRWQRYRYRSWRNK
uniref:Putative secreted peptide n=1 Tax=Anopheles braziliensis TaxID=58242 RepID=A0A2M3ZNS1_9DIPT